MLHAVGALDGLGDTIVGAVEGHLADVGAARVSMRRMRVTFEESEISQSTTMRSL